MEGTTNINQLPSDNVYDANNIVIETKEISDGSQQMTQQMNQMPSSIPQNQQQMPAVVPQNQQQIQHPQQQQIQNQQQQFRPGTPMPQLNQPSNNDATMVQHLNSIQQDNLMQNGSMDLPSRDIPITTNHITQDMNIQPNFIPSGQNNYINNQVSQDMINEYNKQQNNIGSNTDYIYEQLKIPLIITILFYLFNQKFINNFLLSNFPILFTSDQNIKKSGIFLKSILFGLAYFSLDKLIQHFSKI